MKTTKLLYWLAFAFIMLCSQSSIAQLYPNGRELTPKGNQNFIIAYVGFEGFENQPSLGGWSNDISPDFQLPNYLTVLPNGEVSTTNLFFNDANDFTDPAIINDVENQKSISYTLNLLSKPNEDFRFFGEVFTDQNDDPVLVTIDPADYTGGTWTGVNRLAVERMMEIRPDAAYWQQFDQRTNKPNYLVDNSQLPTPDQAIDYIVFIYRYKQSWDPQPINGMAGWAGSGGGFYSGSAINDPNTPVNGFLFNSGMTICQPKGLGSTRRLFIHEYTHSIFLAPHFGSNGTVGDHFYLSTSGGASTSNSGFFYPQLNGWERWLMDYITPIEPTQNTTVVLDDFLTTGDAIRIPIPNSNGQSLWIENHTGNHVLDGHDLTGWEAGPNGVTLGAVEHGVFMYIEDVTDTHVTTNNGIFTAGANGIKYINADGNYDWDFQEQVPPVTNNGGGKLYQFEKSWSNPIAGLNPWMKHVFNFSNFNDDPNDDDDVIDYNSGANNTGVSEGKIMYRELIDGVDQILYRPFGAFANGVTRNPAFEAGDEIGISTNPMILNYPDYIFNEEALEPFILNGLYVKVVSVDNNGAATLEIKFDEITVDKNVRWTGDIQLPNISNDSGDDLILAQDKMITLTQSGTVNRLTISPETNKFINPSVMTITSGSKFHMMENTNLTVKNGSTLVIEDGAEVLLENGACIVIEEDGFLELKGNNIHLNGEKALISMRGTLITRDNVDFTFTGTGYTEFFENHVLQMGQNSNFVLDRLQSGQDTKYLLLHENTILQIDDRELILREGQVEFKTNSKIAANNTEVTFFGPYFVVAEGAPGGGITGFEGSNLTGIDSRYANFVGLTKGVVVTGCATTPQFLHNSFVQCEEGLEASDMQDITLIGNYFHELLNYSIKMYDITTALIQENSIDHLFMTGHGCELTNVEFAYFHFNTYILNCAVGILAEASNVFLSNGTTVGDCGVGVQFINNTTAEYMLSVGRCKCANIINNNVGVQGDNIVLDIDVLEHQFECNSDMPYPNRFDGNNLIFDICYTDPNFQVNNAILMRANYWGGLNLGSYSYNLRDANTPTGCATNVNLNVDDSFYITDSNDLENCGFTEIAYPTTPQYPVEIYQDIYCEMTDGNGTVVMVHNQSQAGYKDLYEKDYISAAEKYTPVAAMDITVPLNDQCVSKVHIARCIVQACANGQFAKPKSELEDIAFKPLKENGSAITVYPNPANQAVTISTKDMKSNQVYTARFYNYLGQIVKVVEFSQSATVAIDQLQNGLYLLEFLHEDGSHLESQKLIVE